MEPELQPPEFRQLALVLREPHTRYVVIGRSQHVPHSVLDYVSTERVPPYLARLFHQFLPEVSEDRLAADVAEFGRMLDAVL